MERTLLGRVLALWKKGRFIIRRLFENIGYKVKFVGKLQVRRKEEDFDEE